MRGWQIFTHSAGLVFRNLDAAFRISLVPYLAHVAVQIYLFLNPGLLAGPDMGTDIDATMGGALPHVEPLTYAIFLCLQFAAALASLWIAVNWHRYVLLEEIAPGSVQPFRGDLVMGYFGRSVLIGLLLAVALFTLAIPAGLLMTSMPGATLPLLLATVAGVTYVFLRLGVILPAGTVGRKLTLHNAWQATGTESGAIAALSVIAVFAMGLMMVPNIIAGDALSLLSMLYSLAASWVITMVGASLLTSLYGICVEGRTIG